MSPPGEQDDRNVLADGDGVAATAAAGGAEATSAAAAEAAPNASPGAPASQRRRRQWLTVTAVLGCGLLALAGTGYRFDPIPQKTAAPGTTTAGASPRPASRAEARLRLERRQLETGLRQKVPRGTWIVIDQTHNRLRLMRGTRLVLEASCSAGSGLILKEGEGKRVWVFDTPRGHFRVLSKLENPVWRKPDWAFVEEGEPIPNNASDRFEYGVLGEYALYFGDGYMIHGTLYERLLGRPVSHGCIRLGREPLREVYRLAPVGTPVYIY